MRPTSRSAIGGGCDRSLFDEPVGDDGFEEDWPVMQEDERRAASLRRPSSRGGRNGRESE